MSILNDLRSMMEEIEEERIKPLTFEVVKVQYSKCLSQMGL